MKIMSDENVISLFKKAGKSPFFPSTVFLLTCHGIFYLLFNVPFPWAWSYSQSKCGPSQVPEHCPVICSDSLMLIPRTLSELDSGSVTGRWMSQPLRTHLGEVGRWQAMGHCVILGSKPLAHVSPSQWLLLVRHKLKGKLPRISIQQPQSIKPKCEALFWVWNPMQLYWPCAHEALVMWVLNLLPNWAFDRLEVAKVILKYNFAISLAVQPLWNIKWNNGENH